MKLRELMPSLDGATVILNEEKSHNSVSEEKPVFIHFWSVSCHLCKKAMPVINDLRDQYKGNLQVISIHMPRLESDLDIEAVKKVVEEYELTHPTLVDQDKIITNRFQNQYVPAYYLFDQKGQLRHFQAGGNSMQMIGRRIERILHKNIGEETP